MNGRFFGVLACWVGFTALGSGCGPVEGATAEPAPEGDRGERSDELLFGGPTAHVIARGIPGAGAIAQVGFFQPGGPIHDNATFAATTEPGKMFDSTRLLVASTSNFGAPLARPGEAAGSVLSIVASGDALNVPPSFAAAGGQASALGGSVQVFSSQSPAFVNGLENPGAVTKDLPGVSLPLGISSNIGFGRPWIANAPVGSDGYGSITVLDVTGRPLAGAPSAVAGGVFAGDQTNRGPASTHGLSRGALATTLVTRSPDGSGRAVFLAALADGSVTQVHVEKGVDGLAPPGSFTPISGITPARAASADPHVVTRVGMAFNWAPNFVAYVTDPLADRVLVLDLAANATTDTGKIFSAALPRYFTSSHFDVPVDLAPTSPEAANGNFSSNTVLGGGSDLYVLNRGNNTVVRVRQDGSFVAERPVVPNEPIAGLRVNGLAVTQDGQTIYVTATAPDAKGYVLKMDAFGEGLITLGLVEAARAKGAQGLEALGADMFSRSMEPFMFMGPLFNGQACSDCHSTPEPGGGDVHPFSVIRVGRIGDDGTFDDLSGRGGPVARLHSISELGYPCGLEPGVPAEATLTSKRHAMTLVGNGLIDSISDFAILAAQAAEPPAVRGRVNLLPDGRIGRFGWKASTATLIEFMGEAFRNEMGMTNTLATSDLVDGCGSQLLKPELDAVPLNAVTAFMNTLEFPTPAASTLASAGAALFKSVGCADCHTPSLTSRGKAAFLYSDLLLHDMGPGLADGFPEGSATGSEFRTMPLWGVSQRVRLLHDGRATSVPEAIAAHGGQAEAARQAYDALSAADRQALLDFLGAI